MMMRTFCLLSNYFSFQAPVNVICLYSLDLSSAKCQSATHYCSLVCNLDVEGSLTGILVENQVKSGNSYQSCCVVVKNMHRCVYAIPSRPLHHTDEMMELEKDVEESRISRTDFHKKLQVSLYF